MSIAAIFAIAFIIQLILSVEGGMITPILPYMADYFNMGKESGVYLGLGFTFIGMFAPFFGMASDFFGKRKIIMAAIGFFILGTFLSGSAQNYIQFILARLVTGIGVFTLNASLISYISDLVPYNQRGRAIGLVRTAWAISIFIAPIYSTQVIKRLGFSWAFWFCSLAAMVAFLFSIKLPKDTSLSSNSKSIDFKELGKLLNHNISRKFMAVTFCWTAAPMMMFWYKALWLEKFFNLDNETIGFVFTISTVGVIAGVLCSAIISDRIGKLKTVKIGMLIMAVCMIPFPFVRNVYSVIILTIIICFGLDGGWSAFQAVASEVFPEKRTIFISLMSLASSSCSLIMTILSPILYRLGGYTFMLLLGSALTFLAFVLTLSINKEINIEQDKKAYGA